MSEKMLYLIHKQNSTNRKGNTMSVATATYKVGDLFTTQKSKVTGTIMEITPNPNGQSVRVKLDVNGTTRYTTWTAK
jgi:hypothetical protein